MIYVKKSEEPQKNEKQYEEIVIVMQVNKDYVNKLHTLIDVKKIFTSKSEASRRALELLFDEYKAHLTDK